MIDAMNVMTIAVIENFNRSTSKEANAQLVSAQVVG